MKLAVIGEPCMDYIHRGSKPAVKQLGGILYSLVSLAVISKGTATVYPVMNLGEDEFDNITDFLKTFDNIDISYIRKTAHNTRVVNLFYKDKDSVLNLSTRKTYDREENSTEPTLPVEFKLAEGLLGSLDGILINLVSGVDITLKSLQQIRDNFKGYIHMDLHNLVMQTFPDGTRKQLPVKNWQEWVKLCDTLQMNESEINILTGENAGEYETAGKILNDKKPSAIAVTRGNTGVSLYEVKHSAAGDVAYQELKRTDVPGIESPQFKDSTGCGDVFASGFFYKNALQSLSDMHSALNYANKMASINASLHGVEELQQLEKI